MGGSCGFTLAEVLIVLGIIGLVADMTIPTLVNSYQKKVTVTRLQKAYSAMDQAIRLSQVDNGNVKDWDFGSGYTKADVEKFVNVYIRPYLKIISKDKFTDEESSISGYGSNKTVLADGTLLSFSLDGSSALGAPPGNLMVHVDINGTAKPNKNGKDEFTMVVRKTNNPLQFFCWKGSGAESCYGAGSTRDDIINGSYYGCRKDKPTKNNCGALIQYDGWKISDDYPW